MKKDRRNILILFLIIMVMILTSYFLFVSGTTSKIKASLNKMESNFNEEPNVSDYPIITMVINSSGEKLVNEDVAITIKANSNYKIDKIYYSYDKEKWYNDAYETIYGKEANFKLLFTDTMNKMVYIKVENEKGYQSYVYETRINIDKNIPDIKVRGNGKEITISLTDNVGLSSIQYSLDGINWDEEEISGKKVTLRKENFEYKFIRTVDLSGNISDIKEVR